MSGTEGGEVDLSEIDAVLKELEAIIEQALKINSRMGWFAAMYRRVTVAVRQAIVDGAFDDGPRMARFDKIFAERFVTAWHQHDEGRPTTLSWGVAFDGAEKRRLIIVQQLLLGMNAHINLDLGIAAAAVAPGEEIESLKSDFNKINDVLSGLVNGFIEQVGELSPWIGLLDRLGGRSEEDLIRFSIDVARRESWALATTLAPLAPVDQAKPIAKRDAETELLGKVLVRPGLVLPFVLGVIRSREPNDVNTVTRFLQAQG